MFRISSPQSIKIDDDTTVEPTLLLRFLTTIHAHLPGRFDQPPRLSFGSDVGMHRFQSCRKPSSPERSCISKYHSHDDHCLRGSAPFVGMIGEAARRQAQGMGGMNATPADLDRAVESYVKQQAAIPAISYAAGMISGLTRAALASIVEGRCIQRIATEVSAGSGLSIPALLCPARPSRPSPHPVSCARRVRLRPLPTPHRSHALRGLEHRRP